MYFGESIVPNGRVIIRKHSSSYYLFLFLVFHRLSIVIPAKNFTMIRSRSSFLFSLFFVAAAAASKTPFGSLVNAIKGGSASNKKTHKKSAIPSSEEDWTDGFASDDPDYNEFLPPLHMESHPLLQMPCSLQTEDQTGKITPTATFIDTGAQVSVLSYQAARRAGVLHLLDRRYAGHALGVGQCRVLGRIPAGAILLHVMNQKLAAPAITILEKTNQGVDLLLGLDFLREFHAILNLRDEELSLLIRIDAKSGNQQNLIVPFIRPRSTSGLMATDSQEVRGENCLADRTCVDSELEGGIDMSGV